MARGKSLNTMDVLGHSHDLASKSIGIHDGVVEIEGFETATGISYNAATENVAVSANHRGGGTYSIEFDKKTHASLTYTLISRTLDSIDLSRFSNDGMVVVYFYLPSPAGNFASVDIILGTSATHNYSWRYLVGSMTAGAWNKLVFWLNLPTTVTGNGMIFDNVDYLAVVANFSAAGDTLVDMKVDSLIVTPCTLMGKFLAMTPVGDSIASADINIHQFPAQPVSYPIFIELDNGAVGTLTVYLDLAGTMPISNLSAGDIREFYYKGLGQLFYKFSNHAGTEVLYWRSGN